MDGRCKDSSDPGERDIPSGLERKRNMQAISIDDTKNDILKAYLETRWADLASGVERDGIYRLPAVTGGIDPDYCSVTCAAGCAIFIEDPPAYFECLAGCYQDCVVARYSLPGAHLAMRASGSSTVLVPRQFIVRRDKTMKGNEVQHGGGSAVRQPYRVRLPGFIHKGDIGLGDVVKRATSSVGIKPCGGCERRAEVLNRWLVLHGSPVGDRTSENRPNSFIYQ